MLRERVKKQTKAVKRLLILVVIACALQVSGTTNAYALPTSVRINEVASNSLLEWVELAGPAGTSLNNWSVQFDNVDESQKVVLGPSDQLDENGFFVINLLLPQLEDDGDTVKLYDDTGVLQQMLVVRPLTNSQSYEATSDGANTFQVTTSPTKGLTNGPAPVINFTAPNDSSYVTELIISADGTDVSEYYFGISGPEGLSLVTETYTTTKQPLPLVNFNLCTAKFVTVSAECPSPLPDGTYILSVGINVYDEGGNPAPPIMRTLFIDTRAPALSDAVAIQNADGTYTISVKTDDPTAATSFSLDGEVLSDALLDDDGTTWRVTTPVLIEGTHHTFSITTTDTAGNSSSISGEIEVPFLVITPIPTSTIGPLPELASTTPPTSEEEKGTVQSSDVIATPTSEQVPETLLGNKEPSSSEAVPILAPSEEGWKFWGIAWYWWLLGSGFTGGLGWWLWTRLQPSDST